MARTTRRAPGDHSVYQRAADGRWCAALTLPDGPDGKRRRKVLTARTREGVMAKLREARRDLDKAGNLATSSPTVNQWMTYWLTEISAKRVRPNTQKNRASDVRLHILPAIGKYRLERLTPDHVRQMHSAIIDKGRSSTTALRCHRLLSVALRDAVRAGRATRNVATREFVDAPSAAVIEHDTLTQDQALAVLAAAAKRADGARWATSLLTGARVGEVLGLEWDRTLVAGDDPRIILSWQLQRLTWEHGCEGKCRYKRAGSCPDRRLDVPANFEHRKAHGGLHLVRPKTKKGYRVVPLVDPLLSVLDRHHQRQSRPTSGLVFTDGDRPIDPDEDYQTWLELLREAGVPRIRRHDARHTAATLLLALGVDTHVIAQILGHSSVVTTRAYQHVNLQLAREAMSRLGAHLTPQIEG